MQIISRQLNEGLVIDGQMTITVVEIGDDQVTFELRGQGGRSQRITLPCAPTDASHTPSEQTELVCC